MTSACIRWRLALGAALIVLSAATAAAGPAYVKSTVNLRAGPGTDQPILGKIPAGSMVEASNCETGWCAVDWQGRSGYAIGSVLDMSGRAPQAPRMARPAPVPPPAAMPVEEDDDIDIAVGPSALYGPPALVYGYPYSYYRPFGYYRYRPYRYGYRGGYRRRW